MLFRSEKEVQEADLNKEMVTLVRRLLRKKTRFEVLEVDPPPLPDRVPILDRCRRAKPNGASSQ